MNEKQLPATYNKGYQTDRFNYDNFPVLDNKILIKTEKAHLEELKAIEEKVTQADLIQISLKRKEHIFSLINSHRKFLNSTRFFFDFNRISMYHTEFAVAELIVLTELMRLPRIYRKRYGKLERVGFSLDVLRLNCRSSAAFICLLMQLAHVEKIVVEEEFSNLESFYNELIFDGTEDFTSLLKLFHPDVHIVHIADKASNVHTRAQEVLADIETLDEIESQLKREKLEKSK